MYILKSCKIILIIFSMYFNLYIWWKKFNYIKDVVFFFVFVINNDENRLVY